MTSFFWGWFKALPKGNLWATSFSVGPQKASYTLGSTVRLPVFLQLSSTRFSPLFLHSRLTPDLYLSSLISMKWEYLGGPSALPWFTLIQDKTGHCMIWSRPRAAPGWPEQSLRGCGLGRGLLSPLLLPVSPTTFFWMWVYPCFSVISSPDQAGLCIALWTGTPPALMNSTSPGSVCELCRCPAGTYNLTWKLSVAQRLHQSLCRAKRSHWNSVLALLKVFQIFQILAALCTLSWA